jgi:ureidoglycolate amidohydrolase
MAKRFKKSGKAPVVLREDVLNTGVSLNSRRLQTEIDELAAISEAAPPVVTRVLFSDADLRARAFVKKICQELGLSLRSDGVGNVFALWRGKDTRLPAVATGSHIDAIPNAGRYDGVVGVLGALEAIRSLKEAGFEPRRGIELIIFTAEEPTRFGIGCLGSRLLAGSLPLSKATALRDREGRDLGYWRKKGGVSKQPLNAVKLTKGRYSAFVELHIEQGVLLERDKVQIGVVEKIAAPSTLQVQLTGVGGHAGAMLMPGRRDALLAAAEIALAVEQAALHSGSPDTVATTGVMRIEPGAVNSVPCRAWLEIDLRDTRVATRDGALRRIEAAVAAICRKRKIKFVMKRLNVDAPAICDPTLVETVEAACRTLKLPVKKMISRAYHDSLFMAQVCPTTMIFIPCRDGVSHRPDEYSSPSQIQRGVEVLAHTLATLAG